MTARWSLQTNLGTGLTEVLLDARDPFVYQEVLEAQDFDAFADSMKDARRNFEGRTIWQVNSTAQGGGVAAMLETLVPYMNSAGVRCRWIVIEGSEDFFEVTKRLHNFLHGDEGDGGHLGPEERSVYEQRLAGSGEELAEMLSPADVVFFNDPQTAGLIPVAKGAGAKVVWRSHIGSDQPNELTREAWGFLREWVRQADALVFSRAQHVWEGLDARAVSIIPPSIDAFSAKNQLIDTPTVEAILNAAGLVGGQTDPGVTPAFTKADGSRGIISRKATFVSGEAPPGDLPIVLQVSRWDQLKDPIGVMKGFVAGVAPVTDAHLVLAGPSVAGVEDDPEGAECLQEVTRVHESLEGRMRRRVHIAVLPMDDVQENAAMVNALQRKAAVVIQKSLAEGFGLTVAEAMWKERPVVAGDVGGIRDQIDDGVSGRLIDPTDLTSFASGVAELLNDRATAAAIGEAAHRRVHDRFLDPRQLMSLLDLAASL